MEVNRQEAKGAGVVRLQPMDNTRCFLWVRLGPQQVSLFCKVFTSKPPHQEQ